VEIGGEFYGFTVNGGTVDRGDIDSYGSHYYTLDNAATGEIYDIIAYFTPTGEPVKHLTLNATEGGAIIAEITVTTASGTEILTFVQTGEAEDAIPFVEDDIIVISYTEETGYTFQIYDVDGTKTKEVSDLTFDDHTIWAEFVKNDNSFTIELATVGSGSVTLTWNDEYTGATTTYTYFSELPGDTDTTPFAAGTKVTVGYEEGDGGIQELVLEVDGTTTSYVKPFDINGVKDKAYVVTGYFSLGGDEYIINFSATGGAVITYSIEGRTVVTLANEDLPFLLRVDVGEDTVVGHGDLFTDFTYSGPYTTTRGWVDIIEEDELVFDTNNDGDVHFVSAVYTVPVGPVGPPTDPTIFVDVTEGAEATPLGSVVVKYNGSLTVTYSALPGYVITGLTVDGLSVAYDTKSGSYSFSKVTSNHIVRVTAEAVDDTYWLSVTIVGGEGYAEYHSGTSPYSRYTRSVTIDDGSDLWVEVVPAEGYEFVKWTQSSSSTSAEIYFTDVHSSITLTAELRSTDSSNGLLDNLWLLIALLLLILLVALLLLFLLFWRRYEVETVTLAGVTINGKNKVVRNKAYDFTVAGAFTGLRYRIGNLDEDEEPVWKEPQKTEKGYRIPGREVVGNITLEAY
jgi:hypothetical protein